MENEWDAYVSELKTSDRVEDHFLLKEIESGRFAWRIRVVENQLRRKMRQVNCEAGIFSDYGLK